MEDLLNKIILYSQVDESEKELFTKDFYSYLGSEGDDSVK